MKIRVTYLEDVAIIGDVSTMRDVLVAQVRAPPGAVLDSLKFCPDEKESNQVHVSCRLDPNCSKGETRCRSEWFLLNRGLARHTAAGLDARSKADTICDGDCETDDDEFVWRRGKQSMLTSVDPCRLALRKKAARAGRSPFEIEEVSTKGNSGVDTVPCFLATVFSLVEKPRHCCKGEPRMNGSNDEDTQRQRRDKRGHGGDDDSSIKSDMDLDEDGDNGGGKPRSKGKKKKSAPVHGANIPSAVSAASMFGSLIAMGATHCSSSDNNSMPAPQ